MDRVQRALAGLLVLQLLVLALLHNPFARRGPAGEQPLLPKLASLTPARVEVANGDGAAVEFRREGGAWVLGRPDGYPVLPGKVEKLIQDLEHLTAARPVASDRSSHAALRVAADRFERRVRFWTGPSGGPEAELFVGTSAGSGASHVRAGGSDRVFEANGVASYDLPADAGPWIERNLVPIQADSATGLEVANRKGSFALVSQGGTWRVRSPAARAGAALDQEKVRELARTLCGLSLDEPVGPVDERAQGLADPEAKVVVEGRPAGADSAAAAVSVTVRLGAPVPGKQDTRYAARSGLGFAVTVPRYAYDRALSVELKELVKR